MRSTASLFDSPRLVRPAIVARSLRSNLSNLQSRRVKFKYGTEGGHNAPKGGDISVLESGAVQPHDAQSALRLQLVVVQLRLETGVNHDASREERRVCGEVLGEMLERLQRVRGGRYQLRGLVADFWWDRSEPWSAWGRV